MLQQYLHRGIDIRWLFRNRCARVELSRFFVNSLLCIWVTFSWSKYCNAPNDMLLVFVSDAVSSLTCVLLWFYLARIQCIHPTLENCPLIYDQELECVTSTGSIMMPIWVLLKMVYVLFLSGHNVPKGAAQMTLGTLFRISEFSHN